MSGRVECTHCKRPLAPDHSGPCPSCHHTEKTIFVEAHGAAGAKGVLSSIALERPSSSFGFLGPKVVQFYRWLAGRYEKHVLLSLILSLVLLIGSICLPVYLPSTASNWIGGTLAVIGAFLNPLTVTITREIYYQNPN